MTSKTLKVEGMSCHHCTEAVSRAVRALAGVQNVEVSLNKKSAEVRYDEIPPERGGPGQGDRGGRLHRGALT